MELPWGFDKYDGVYVLKLKSNFYGLCDAGLTWFEHLKKGLELRGLKQSKLDPCLFLKKDLIVIVYVDDCLIFSTKLEGVEEFLESMRKRKPGEEHPFEDKGFDFTDDGDLQTFLGVKFEREGDVLKMIQPMLILRIIEAVSFDKVGVNSKPTPSTYILLKDENGEERKDVWSYRSVVGMLNYLANTTRPDISMAVHQCARFSNEPKLSHEKAVKRIIKYLIGTKNLGLKIKVNMSLGFKAYADSDFANGWNKLNPDDIQNLFSRTGFITFFFGIPLTWCSKLQTRIALSSTEAEYTALSTCLRDIILVMNLVKEIAKIVELPKITPALKCTAFEDNESAIKVAKAPTLTPRTKHIALEMHHFRAYVATGLIDIESIDTLQQIADILTKPLGEQQFLYLRKLMMGE